jgi:hypothetical protein
MEIRQMTTDDLSRAQRSSLLLLGSPAEAEALVADKHDREEMVSVVRGVDTLRAG